MKKILLLITTASLGLLSSCTYDKIEEKPLPETVSYKDDIQPIWDHSCTPCHTPSAVYDPDLSPPNSRQILIDGGFVIPGNADGSTLYQVISGPSPAMPPGGKLSQEKVDLVKKWINDGALNN